MRIINEYRIFYIFVSTLVGTQLLETEYACTLELSNNFRPTQFQKESVGILIYTCTYTLIQCLLNLQLTTGIYTYTSVSSVVNSQQTIYLHKPAKGTLFIA